MIGWRAKNTYRAILFANAYLGADHLGDWLIYKQLQHDSLRQACRRAN